MFCTKFVKLLATNINDRDRLKQDYMSLFRKQYLIILHCILVFISMRSIPTYDRNKILLKISFKFNTNNFTRIIK